MGSLDDCDTFWGIHDHCTSWGLSMIVTLPRALGEVAQLNACPPGMWMVMDSILTSGKTSFR